jgi:SAM-dependent methyltransferase
MSLRVQIGRVRNRLTGSRRSKGDAELAYWRGRHREQGELTGEHYEWFYTTSFGLSRDDYAGKRILDIGCGPRGTLEWASGAAERVGLDPLADRYAEEFGIDRHAMSYVAAGAEDIPFPDGHFDIVTAFNALDHVDDIDATMAEMTRVARVGALALVLVEVGHAPTPTEPQSLGWDFLDGLPHWHVLDRRRAALRDDHSIYSSWREGAPWESGPGLLGGRLERTE